MDEINIGEILSYLGPSTGVPIWNILLYIIFFLALFTLFSLPDKNVVPTLLIATVLMCAVIAKLSLSAPDPIFRRGEFGMFVINALMFTFPFITLGTTRKLRLKRSVKSNLPALLTGIMGGVYFFMFWFFMQRGLGLA
jgi:hypothetical protein